MDHHVLPGGGLGLPCYTQSGRPEWVFHMHFHIPGCLDGGEFGAPARRFDGCNGLHVWAIWQIAVSESWDTGEGLHGV